MREKLFALIEEQADFRPVIEETTFEEMGMDSLDFMLLIQEIDTEIAHVSRKELQYCSSAGDILKVLEWQLQPK